MARHKGITNLFSFPEWTASRKPSYRINGVAECVGFDFSDPAMSGTVRRMHAYMQTILSYETTLLREYDTTLVVLGELKPSR